MDGSRIFVRQQGESILFQGTSARSIRKYFSLHEDLQAIAREIDQDPFIHSALGASWGLRVIQQDPWECLAGFILSSFNNIIRLTGMLNRLAVRFGETMEEGPISRENEGLSHRFPGPEILAKVSERSLRFCGLGFRAAYLKSAAQAVVSGAADLSGWGKLEDEALRRQLLCLPGVGEKVVECVMLFAYGRDSAFPVDVWIGRSMRRWYFRGRNVSGRQIREFAYRHFGPMCGWAQQYLYSWARGGRPSLDGVRRPS